MKEFTVYRDGEACATVSAQSPENALARVLADEIRGGYALSEHTDRSAVLVPGCWSAHGVKTTA